MLRLFMGFNVAGHPGKGVPSDEHMLQVREKREGRQASLWMETLVRSAPVKRTDGRL